MNSIELLHHGKDMWSQRKRWVAVAVSRIPIPLLARYALFIIPQRCLQQRITYPSPYGRRTRVQMSKEGVWCLAEGRRGVVGEARLRKAEQMKHLLRWGGKG